MSESTITGFLTNDRDQLTKHLTDFASSSLILMCLGAREELAILVNIYTHVNEMSNIWRKVCNILNCVYFNLLVIDHHNMHIKEQINQN